MSRDIGKLGDDTGGHRRYHGIRSEGQSVELIRLSRRAIFGPLRFLGLGVSFLQLRRGCHGFTRLFLAAHSRNNPTGYQ